LISRPRLRHTSRVLRVLMSAAPTARQGQTEGATAVAERFAPFTSDRLRADRQAPGFPLGSTQETDEYRPRTYKRPQGANPHAEAHSPQSRFPTRDGYVCLQTAFARFPLRVLLTLPGCSESLFDLFDNQSNSSIRSDYFSEERTLAIASVFRIGGSVGSIVDQGSRLLPTHAPFTFIQPLVSSRARD
jgi:hypothetical protein